VGPDRVVAKDAPIPELVNAVAQLIQGPRVPMATKRGAAACGSRSGMAGFPPKSQQLTRAVPIRLVQIGVRTVFYTPAAGA
jgi:hypothetical protein